MSGQQEYLDYVAIMAEPLFVSRKAPHPDAQFNAVIPKYSPRIPTFPGPEQLHWEVYAEGYKAAGDWLVLSVIDRRGFEQNFLVYPIAALYRHALELALKELINTNSQLTGGLERSDFNHPLASLWNKARDSIGKVFRGEENKWLSKLVEARLKEFDEVDASSQGFRYPIDRTGNPTLKSIDAVNLKHLKDVVECVSAIISGSSTGMYEHLRMKAEMKAEIDQYNHYNNERW